jgi:hypothetical protein
MSRAVFFASLIAAAPAFAEARYFSALSDLPMPPGFSETNTAVGFDGMRGRLVVADAAGAENPTQVRSFYTQTLPALGWSPSPTNDDSVVFVRGRERLTLEVSDANGRTQVHVQLVVRPPPSDGD